MPNTPSPAVRFVGAVKSILPAQLHSFARRLWRWCYARVQDLPEVKLYLEYWLFRLKGGTYLQWYASTLDRWVESRDPEFLAKKRAVLVSSGSEDVEVLKSFGMRPDSTLHEFGCGQLRSALHFVEYLAPGNFSANDASKGRIDLGLELFGDRIRPRNPALIVNPDNGFDWLKGRKFDFIWCHAVLGHMPAEDIEDTVRDVRKAMHANSMFLFTYDEPRAHFLDAKEDVVRVDSRNFYQSADFYRKLASKYGYQFADVSEAIRPFKSYHQFFRLGKMTLLPPGR